MIKLIWTDLRLILNLHFARAVAYLFFTASFFSILVSLRGPLAVENLTRGRERPDMNLDDIGKSSSSKRSKLSSGIEMVARNLSENW